MRKKRRRGNFLPLHRYITSSSEINEQQRSFFALFVFLISYIMLFSQALDVSLYYPHIPLMPIFLGE